MVFLRKQFQKLIYERHFEKDAYTMSNIALLTDLDSQA